MKRDSSVGLQATQLTGCVCAAGKQVQSLSHTGHACTCTSTSSWTSDPAVRRPLTVVGGDQRLLAEIPHFNSTDRKHEPGLRCNQHFSNSGKATDANKQQHEKASPTVQAASHSSAGPTNRADCAHNVVVVMFSEAIHQQLLILCQLPQFQSTCRPAAKQSPA